MKDFLGKELTIGDNVLVVLYNSQQLKIATVINITDKMILVKWGEKKHQNRYEYSSKVVKISDQDLTWHLLNKQ